MKIKKAADFRRGTLALIVLVAVIVVAVVAICFTLARINALTLETDAKNEAVGTCADIAELFAAADSAHAFEANLKESDYAPQGEDGKLVCAHGQNRYVLILRTAPRANGTMLSLAITARWRGETIYTLKTKHYAKTD